jgi:hypothetical protein
MKGLITFLMVIVFMPIGAIAWGLGYILDLPFGLVQEAWVEGREVAERHFIKLTNWLDGKGS